MDTSNRPKANAKNSRTHSGSASGCCGGPAPAGTDACCAQDAAVKSSGGSGCGCGCGPLACAEGLRFGECGLASRFLAGSTSGRSKSFNSHRADADVRRLGAPNIWCVSDSRTNLPLGTVSL